MYELALIRKIKFFRMEDITEAEPLRQDCIYPLKLTVGDAIYKVAYSDFDLSGVLDIINGIPSIPTVYDQFKDSGVCYYVTDYKTGIRKVTLEEATSEWFYCALVDLMETLNSQGLYYDDLDDDNVHLDDENNIHIIDIGGFCFDRNDQKPRIKIDVGDHDEIIPLPL